jgi:hypothetical protein
LKCFFVDVVRIVKWLKRCKGESASFSHTHTQIVNRVRWCTHSYYMVNTYIRVSGLWLGR